jgi:peptidoglycan/LPS O-acetylase OafA/YrhL
MQNNFHLTRFIAATLVLYGHCYPLTNRGTYDEITLLSQGIFPAAHMGVCIFFIVSGYLVSQSLQNSPTIINFIWKRIIRIFPALIVVIIICVAVGGFFFTTLSLKEYWQNPETYRFLKLIKLYPHVGYTLPGVFKTLPIKDVNGSLWTLPYEVTMYLFLVVLQLCGLFSKRNIILFLFFFSFPFTTYLFFNYHPTRLIPILHLTFTDTLEFGIYFMTGTLMNFFKDIIPFRFRYFAIMVLLWFGLGLVHITTPIMIKTISFLALPYIVLYLAILKGKLNDFGKMGDFSYGIYIYAFPVQQIIVQIYGTEISIAKMFMMSFSIVLLLSILSWYLIEEKALRLKSLSFV